MKTTIYLIRHAETIWNMEGRVQGFLDSPLTPKGCDQATKLLGWLAANQIDAVFSSDTGRCLETAKLALDSSPLTLEARPDLRERNLGDWEGRLVTDIIIEDRDGFERYKRDATYRPPNGESFLEVQGRAFAAMVDIVARHSGKNIVVFTSGGALRSIVMKAMAADPNTWAFWATWNTGISTLTQSKGAFHLIKFNETAHLNGTGSLNS